MDPGEENPLPEARKTLKIYRVGHRSMAAVQRGIFPWEECLGRGNTGMLTMSLTGKGTGKSTAGKRGAQIVRYH
jgi:hypothetical protein